MLTTKIKHNLNAVLHPLGLEVSTTLAQSQEKARLHKLQQKGHWQEARYGQGLAWQDEKYLAWLTKVCLPYQSEYQKFALDPTSDGSYFLRNNWFEAVDAEVLYCFLRHFQPRQVIEVGSGFSSRVMRRAIREGRLATRITCIDPQPNSAVSPYADEYIKQVVEDVPLARITETLTAGDVLFIDSSHLIKSGGDLPYLLLEVIPRLPVGTFIHLHDIFLPFEYPEPWIVEEQWGWNEQYLLQAFLCFNQAFETIWPAQYMWRNHRETLLQTFSPAVAKVGPSSWWLTRVA